MNSEKRQRLVGTLKTALLALVITLLLVVMVAVSNKNAAKTNSRNENVLEQRISKLETTLRDNHETLEETRNTNETLRQILSELRGIHNDCQRNSADSFLHPSRRR